MTELLERPAPATDIGALPVVSAIKQVIDAHLADIHSEPAGRHELIVSALMLGSAATGSQLQV